MSFAEPPQKRTRDVALDIRDTNRPHKNEDFHSLILAMMKGSNEHRTEAETRIQDLADLMLVKFQEEVIPYIIVGVKSKILSEAKRGDSVTGCSLKWNYIPYYNPEKGATHIDLSESGRRSDMVIEVLKKEFPNMVIQTSYSGPYIAWAGF